MDALSPEIKAILLGCFALLLLYVVSRMRKKKVHTTTIEDITMTPEGRRLYVHREVMETICDGLVTLCIDGKITDDEANVQMARLAKLYGLEEMIPLIRNKKPKLLKAQLKNNERKRSLTKRLWNKETTKVPIPEPEDIKTTNVVKMPVKTEAEPSLIASILKGKAL
jgi:hypothetical protein